MNLNYCLGRGAEDQDIFSILNNFIVERGGPVKILAENQDE